jgi:hypothetical protein
VLVTAGMFALEVLGYIVITRRFPVLPREAATLAVMTLASPIIMKARVYAARRPAGNKVCSLRSISPGALCVVFT